MQQAVRSLARTARQYKEQQQPTTILRSQLPDESAGNRRAIRKIAFLSHLTAKSSRNSSRNRTAAAAGRSGAARSSTLRPFHAYDEYTARPRGVTMIKGLKRYVQTVLYDRDFRRVLLSVRGALHLL